MIWAKFDDHMASHPKCAPLSDAAFRLLIHANLWARARGTHGFIPQGMLTTLPPGRSARAAIAAAKELVAAGAPLHGVGLWEPTDGGWHIHDFDEYGPNELRSSSGDSHRRLVDPELSRKRAESGKKGGHASGVARQRPQPGVATLEATEANPQSNGASSAQPIEANPRSDSDPEPDPDRISPKPPEANGSKPAGETDDGSFAQLDADRHIANCATVPLGERAKQFLRSSGATMARYGSPLEWPEVQAVWRAFESTWRKADRPREFDDPRVKVVLERYAAGRTPEELSCAIRASKLYPPVADNPAYRRIKTILKDDEQVDNLLRLAEAPNTGNGHARPRQRGGWKAPETERTN